MSVSADMYQLLEGSSPPTLVRVSGKGAHARMEFDPEGDTVKVVTWKSTKTFKVGGALYKRKRPKTVPVKTQSLDRAHARNLWRKLIASGDWMEISKAEALKKKERTDKEVYAKKKEAQIAKQVAAGRDHKSAVAYVNALARMTPKEADQYVKDLKSYKPLK